MVVTLDLKNEFELAMLRIDKLPQAAGMASTVASISEQSWICTTERPVRLREME